MLAGLREVLDPAVDAGTGVGAFNVICLEHAEAVVWGAEAANVPVVLQVSENAVLYHRSLEPILIATVALARNADIPAVVHLDHVTDPDLVRAGVELLQWRGTARGVRAAVGALLDTEPEIVESGGAAWSETSGAALPGSERAELLVRIAVDDPEAFDVRRLEALIALIKPAHVPHRVEVRGVG